MNLSNVLSLLGGVALFLFGMTVMGDSLKKVAGNKLELILFKLSSTPVKGVLLGFFVTAVIQSSSATTIMVIGFVNAGMMSVAQAIGVILGANVGTSVTGWVLCLSMLGNGGGGWVSLLSTSTLTAVIALIGIVLRMLSKSDQRKHIGDILMGFAVLMFGMEYMSAAVSPLKESAAFQQLLVMFSNPFLGILVGVLFTAVLQSASAAVGILQALSMTGAITVGTAVPIIMGIAIGASVPVLLGAIGANTGGKRTSLIYLFINILGTLIWATVFYVGNAFLRYTFLGDIVGPVELAFINTLFRLLSLLALLPFLKALRNLVCRLVPERPEDREQQLMIDRLEDRFVNHPTLAIEQSKLVLSNMANIAATNLFNAIDLLKHFTEAGYAEVDRLEGQVDTYEDKLGTYLVKVTQKELNRDQNKEISKFLHCISDFERISDHAVNIAEVAKEIYDKKMAFSFEAERESGVLISAVKEIVTLSVQAFVGEDLSLAGRVEPLEQMIDMLSDEIKLHHIDRVKRGNCTLNQGFVFNDLLTNLERVADHCSNIAVAMIELDMESFDTHQYLNSLNKVQSGSFSRYFEEYKTKYALDDKS